MGYESHAGYENTLAVERFLDHPEDLRHSLEAQGALDFIPYKSGLFPASNLTREQAKATQMGMSWSRDNAHIAYALFEAGKPELAVPVAGAMMQILNNSRRNIDAVVHGTLNPNFWRIPIRVDGETLEEDPEHRVQNDSVGYKLWLISNMVLSANMPVRGHDIETLAQTVRYLDKIKYWADADTGHWEEDKRVNVPSIGANIAGLRAAKQLFEHVGYRHSTGIDQLLQRGEAAKTHILSRGVTDMPSLHGTDLMTLGTERHFPGTVQPSHSVLNFFRQFTVQHRMYDAAMLFLVRPLQVLDDTETALVIQDIEQCLLGHRQHGIARYVGDTYWSPRFKDIMTIEERTSAKGSLARRNQIAASVGYTGTEAQWTLFDPLLSEEYGSRYKATGDQAARQKQLLHLQRSLNQLAPNEDGNLRMPEAYYFEYTPQGGRWVANDHTPLLWSQANLLRALVMFEKTS